MAHKNVNPSDLGLTMNCHAVSLVILVSVDNLMREEILEEGTESILETFIWQSNPDSRLTGISLFPVMSGFSITQHRAGKCFRAPTQFAGCGDLVLQQGLVSN